MKITLANGTTFNVSFDGRTNLGGVLAALNNAADVVGVGPNSANRLFSAQPGTNSLTEGIVLIDSSFGPEGFFKVEAINGSMSGLPGIGLGILGLIDEPDEDGKRILRGAALHGDTLANHVYFVSEPTDKPQFSVAVDLTAENINATGSLGPATVTITGGSGSAHIASSLQLTDPNIIPGTQNRITMAELARAVVKTGQGSGGDDLIHVQQLNGVSALTLPATASLLPGTGGAPITDSGTLLVNWNPMFGAAGTASTAMQPQPDNMKVTVTGFSKIKQLEKLSPENLANAFELASKYFEQLLNDPTGLLKQNIPGLEQNVADLIDIDQLLAATGKALKGQALQQLSLLEEQLESAVETAVKLPKTPGVDGPVVELSLDESQGTALKVSIQLPFDLAKNSAIDANKSKPGLQVPFGLNLLNGGNGGATSVNDTNGDSLIDVTANADFVIALGIDLSNPSTPQPFLYGGDSNQATKAQVRVKAHAANMQFNASVGPLGLFVQNGSFDLNADGAASTQAPALFEAKLSPGRHYLRNPGTVAAATSVSLVAGVSGALPVYFPTKAETHRLAPDLKLEIDSLQNFLSSPSFTVNPQTPTELAANSLLYVPDLASAIDNMNFLDGISGFAAGWDGVFAILDAVVDNKVFVQKIPLIGDQLVNGSQFLLDIKDQVSADLTNAAAAGLGETQRILFNALGPGGLNWLRDRNGDGSVTRSDVIVWAADVGATGAGANITEALIAGQPPVSSATRTIMFDMRLEQPIANVGIPLDIDLALPGLGLDIDGGVNLRAGASLDLRIGIDRNQGVFLDTTRTDEFKVTIDATLPGLRADASLGFLDLEVRDSQSNPSHIGGGYFVDFVDPNGDGRLTLSELGRARSNPGQLLRSRFSPSGTQAINLDFETSFDGNANFPQLSGQFEIKFDTGVRDGSGLFDFEPNVAINNVRMNPGQAINAFAGPILERVAAVLEPIKPVTDFITAPLPLISDLAGTPVTMLDVAEIFGYVTPETREYIEAAKIIVDLAADYRKVGDGSILIGSLNLADLNLRTQSVNTLDIDAVRDDLLQLEDLDVQLEGSSAGGFLDRAASAPSAGDEEEGGIRFPLFENPKLAFKLLLGQDVDLFVYDMPRLDTQFTYAQQFPIFPPFLWGVVEGKLEAAADFAFGFDTRGLRQFQTSRNAADIFNGFFVFDVIDGVDVPEAVLQGSLSVTAGPPQIPKLKTGIGSIEARAGITGGLFATANFNLNDPNQDGKVHFDELKAAFQAAVDHSDPLYVFDVDGNIRLELFAFVHIEGSIKIAGKKKSKTIADIHQDIIPPIVLKEFSAHREIPPIIEATPPPEPDILGLVSQFEGRRAITLDLGSGSFDINASNVIHVSRASNGNYSISVNGTGMEIANSANAEVIAIDAGLGDDTVTVDSSITIPAYLTGGAGDDTLIGGSGNDVLRGGSGADRLEGKGGADQLFGELNNDTLLGGDGNDRLDGGNNDDFLWGGSGDDILIGGGATDELYGEADDDILIAGISQAGGDAAAIHRLYGGDGDDHIYGDLGTDRIAGGSGHDRIYAYAGDDTIYADGDGDAPSSNPGDDVVYAGAGSDEVYGGWGADLIFAGINDAGGGAATDKNEVYSDPKSGGAPGSLTNHNDTVYGDIGEDFVTTGPGDDIIRTFAGSDIIDAGDGNDTITAGTGSNTITGGWGRDTIYAGANALGNGSPIDRNIVYGDIEGFADGRPLFAPAALPVGTTDSHHADSIFGDAGPDIIYASSGSDVITTFGGNDIVHAGGGDNTISTGAPEGSNGADSDVVTAGSGNDRIVTGRGDDSVHAGDGNNFVDLGSGNDSAITGAGNDIVFGGSGSEVISTGAGDDIIQAGYSQTRGTEPLSTHTIDAGPGDDEIYGDDGADILTGGIGSDLIYGFGGDDDIVATNRNNDADPLDGDDRVYGGLGSDLLIGGWGRDVLYAGDDRKRPGYQSDSKSNTVYSDVGPSTRLQYQLPISGNHGDFIQTDDGQDLIFADWGDDTIYSLAGSDTIHAGWGSDIVYAGLDSRGGGNSNDQNTVFADPDTLAPSGLVGSNADSVYTDAGSDTVHAGPDDDFVFTFGGSDHVWAGSGNDVLSLGSGDNRAYGEDGDDVIESLEGNDEIYAGAGNDEVQSGGGDDFIEGGRGDDRILAGAGRDIVFGGLQRFGIEELKIDDASAFVVAPGFDFAEQQYPTGYTERLSAARPIVPRLLYGLTVDGEANDGMDIIDGGSGGDWLFGGSGVDEVRGSDGDDYIDGGAGNDVAQGGLGDDVVRGGSNSDVVHGDGGIDQVYGDDGADQVFGDAGLIQNIPSIAVTNYSPLDFALQFTVGSTLRGLTLTTNELSNNSSIDHLVGDLNAALAGINFGQLLEARRIDDTKIGIFAAGGYGTVMVGKNSNSSEFTVSTEAVHLLAGQRLYGGDGIDSLWAFAPTTNAARETDLVGDQLFGGGSGDFVYGNIRQEILVGDSGNDTLLGDYLIGPALATNRNADTVGGRDRMFGDSGEDKLYGGGGNDELWGGSDSDWLEGQLGSDALYGGAGIDMMLLDASDPNGTRQVYNGHGGNRYLGDAGVEGKGDVPVYIDILLVEGTSENDTIEISQTQPSALGASALLHVHIANSIEDKSQTAAWLSSGGIPQIEQFRISGLNGDDTIRFLDQNSAQLIGRYALDVGVLDSLTDDFAAVIDGGPGNDTLSGTSARDRIDGGFGSDVIFGFAGDDQLWGDGGPGQGRATDRDILFAGQGHDDLLGGQGTNELYAWSFHPEGTLGATPPSVAAIPPTQFGVYVDAQGTLYADDGDLNNDGFLDVDQAASVIGPYRAPYVLEDTGLNRMLGGERSDLLYGGTGLDFMYGNSPRGVDDRLYNRSGKLFEAADAGLAGQEWKQYAMESDKVWYYGGSNIDDVITVDFVTEPGLLSGHHLITRLTNNNGNFTFDATGSVRLRRR